MSYQFKSTSYEFKSTSNKLKSTSQKTKSTSCKIKSTSWEIKSTSQEIKSPSLSSKTTRCILNIRVKKENSEFKILNFKSCKKFYFYCLPNAELKPHTKVLKKTFPQHDFDYDFDHYIASCFSSLEALTQIRLKL